MTNKNSKIQKLNNKFNPGRVEGEEESDNLDCIAALMPIDVPAPRGPIFVFGDFFLRKFYTVFDRDEKVVGIARANHKKVENVEKYFKDIVTPYDIESKNKNEISSLEEKSKNINAVIFKEGISGLRSSDVEVDLVKKLDEYPEFLEVEDIENYV